MVQYSVLVSFLLAALGGGAVALFCRKGLDAFFVAVLVTPLLSVILAPTAAHYAEQLSIWYNPEYKVGWMSPAPGAAILGLIVGPITGAVAGSVAAVVVRGRSMTWQQAKQAKQDRSEAIRPAE